MISTRAIRAQKVHSLVLLLLSMMLAIAAPTRIFAPRYHECACILFSRIFSRDWTINASSLLALNTSNTAFEHEMPFVADDTSTVCAPFPGLNIPLGTSAVDVGTAIIVFFRGTEDSETCDFTAPVPAGSLHFSIGNQLNAANGGNGVTLEQIQAEFPVTGILSVVIDFTAYNCINTPIETLIEDSLPFKSATALYEVEQISWHSHTPSSIESAGSYFLMRSFSTLLHVDSQSCNCFR